MKPYFYTFLSFVILLFGLTGCTDPDLLRQTLIQVAQAYAQQEQPTPREEGQAQWIEHSTQRVELSTPRAELQAQWVEQPSQRVDLQPGLIHVQFTTGTISEKDTKSMRLLGGSIWNLHSISLALPFNDIWIVLTENNSGIAYVDGEEFSVVYQSGPYLLESGLFGKVIASSEDGEFLELGGGSVWSIHVFDRFDTRWWRPPYPVLITNGGRELVNLKKGKRVRASKVK